MAIFKLSMLVSLLAVYWMGFWNWVGDLVYHTKVCELQWLIVKTTKPPFWLGHWTCCASISCAKWAQRRIVEGTLNLPNREEVGIK